MEGQIDWYIGKEWEEKTEEDVENLMINIRILEKIWKPGQTS